VLPIATEAPTLGALVHRAWEIAPEIATVNGHQNGLKLCSILQTVTPARWPGHSISD
jgi:hypothetical protein